MRWSLSALWSPRKWARKQHCRASLDAIPHRKVGLALSAGGAKGLARVGVLQVLEENGIEIDAIAGCSMGSYIGALWACGYSGPDLEELAAEIQDRKKLWTLADPVLPPLSGLLHGRKAKHHLMRSIGKLRFEDLARRLLIVTFDPALRAGPRTILATNTSALPARAPITLSRPEKSRATPWRPLAISASEVSAASRRSSAKPARPPTEWATISRRASSSTPRTPF